MPELGLDEIQRARGDCGVALVRPQAVRLEVQRGELGIVVEHFFIVRRTPVGIRGVAKKTAVDVIV